MSISDESALMDSGLHTPTVDNTDGKQDPLWQKIQKKVSSGISGILVGMSDCSLDFHSLVQLPPEEAGDTDH